MRERVKGRRDGGKGREGGRKGREGSLPRSEYEISNHLQAFLRALLNHHQISLMKNISIVSPFLAQCFKIKRNG
jgi:hypothetical protein